MQENIYDSNNLDKLRFKDHLNEELESLKIRETQII